MNRRDLMLGVAAAALVSKLPAPQPEPKLIPTSWGIDMGGTDTDKTSVWVVSWASGKKQVEYLYEYEDRA